MSKRMVSVREMSRTLPWVDEALPSDPFTLTAGGVGRYMVAALSMCGDMSLTCEMTYSGGCKNDQGISVESGAAIAFARLTTSDSLPKQKDLGSTGGMLSLGSLRGT